MIGGERNANHVTDTLCMLLMHPLETPHWQLTAYYSIPLSDWPRFLVSRTPSKDSCEIRIVIMEFGSVFFSNCHAYLLYLQINQVVTSFAAVRSSTSSCPGSLSGPPQRAFPSFLAKVKNIFSVPCTPRISHTRFTTVRHTRRCFSIAYFGECRE